MAQDMGESVSNALPKTMNEKLKIDREEHPNTNISSTSLARSGIISTAANVLSSSSSDSMLWVLDTGATDHMTPNKVCIIAYDPITNSHSVLTAGGEVLDVEGSGPIRLAKCTLKDVLHVPRLKMNLISLQQYVKDTGWRFILDDDDCFFCDKVTGKQIFTVKREAELLLLDEDQASNFSSAHLLRIVETLELLHRRMGHPAFEVLRRSFPSQCKNVDMRNFFCEACELAKHHRFSFKSYGERFLKPFERIHSDVRGPCHMQGLNGHRWFIVFIDDCTRFTWVYFLKSKADVPLVIIQFFELIKTQFNTHVKCFRSDNAKEFFTSEINIYMNDKGITHESSCVGTP